MNRKRFIEIAAAMLAALMMLSSCGYREPPQETAAPEGSRCGSVEYVKGVYIIRRGA